MALNDFIVNCIVLEISRFSRQVDDTVFRFDHDHSIVIITNVLRGLQRKPEKQEMSKLFYFVHLMLMKNGIEFYYESHPSLLK